MAFSKKKNPKQFRDLGNWLPLWAGAKVLAAEIAPCLTSLSCSSLKYASHADCNMEITVREPGEKIAGQMVLY